MVWVEWRVDAGELGMADGVTGRHPGWGAESVVLRGSFPKMANLLLTQPHSQ